MATDTEVNVQRRTAVMMHRLSQMQFTHGDKAADGAYDGRARQLRDDVKRLNSYVLLILQKALNDRIFYRVLARCDALFLKLKEVDWVIPVDGEMMKELEGCEFEVVAASVVIVSAVFLICLSPSL